MGRALYEWLKQESLFRPAAEALLNVLVCTQFLREDFSRILASFGVTLPQYNVLRILRGAHPGSHTRHCIAERMIERSSDVTRLIDRLVTAGYAKRSRARGDKRECNIFITKKGLELLNSIDPILDSYHDEVERRISPDRLKVLSETLEDIYSGAMGATAGRFGQP